MRKLYKGAKIGIVSCSNGIANENRHKIELLVQTLGAIGLKAILSDHVFERYSVFSGTAKERADALMNLYRDDSIEAIFDVSGGDIANEILRLLDFDVIAGSKKEFWGYSDLTTILNAVYAKTGKSSVLYQIRNLIKEDGENQKQRFIQSVFGADADTDTDLLSFSYDFVQGDHMEGIVVGGNLRCFLKLAGTPFWPDLNGKILLLESWGGRDPQMATFLSQLQLTGAFEQVSGVLLGTFTMMQQENCQPDIIRLVKEYAGTQVPIAKTELVGHGCDSRAVEIGVYKEFGRK